MFSIILKIFNVKLILMLLSIFLLFFVIDITLVSISSKGLDTSVYFLLNFFLSNFFVKKYF